MIRERILCSAFEMDLNYKAPEHQEANQSILKGVIAYVDVRYEGENRTEVFQRILKRMGATIAKRVNKNVTHVIFCDGTKKAYQKAKKCGVYLLSFKWVLSCKEHQSRLPEKEFPAIVSSEYDSPFSKIRVLRSLRSLTVEEYRKRDIANEKRQKTRKEMREFRKRLEKGPPPLYIPRDYSKYKKIRSSFDPAILKDCKEKWDKLIPVEEDYDIDDHEMLPLPLRILKNNPNPESPVINMLTKKQKIAARLILERHGKKIPDSLKNISEPAASPILKSSKYSEQDGDLSGTISEMENSQLEPNEEDNAKEEKGIFGLPLSTIDCVNETTPQRPRKRKRQLTLEEKPAVSLNEISSNSLDEFKPKRKNLKKPKDISNLKDLLNESDSLRLENSSLKIDTSNSKQIILSSYSNWEKETLFPIIQHLGNYRIHDSIIIKTTHVICGRNRRTYNVLMGIVYGCWILNSHWIMDSLDANKWLDETKYEIEEFPGAKISRQKRMQSKGRYHCDLFKSITKVFVTKKTNISRGNLETLLKSAGAKVVSSISKASIIIGNENLHDCEKTIVTEYWVLDCISNFTILPMENYLVNS